MSRSDEAHRAMRQRARFAATNHEPRQTNHEKKAVAYATAFFYCYYFAAAFLASALARNGADSMMKRS